MIRGLAVLLCLWVAAPAAASCVAETGPAVTGAVIEGANALRRQAGRGALKASPALSRAAAAHACDMALRGFFDHKGSDASTLMPRVKRAGYRACFAAENIAWGYSAPEAVLAGWRDSAGHRANLLHRKAREAGVARASGGGKTYWVMVLASPC